MKAPVLRAILAIGAASALLASCGTTSTPAPSETPTSAAPETESAAGTEPASGPITLTDGRGEEVTLEQPATKVVALEWAQAEAVAAVGVTPVGMSDVENYKVWVGEGVPLPGEPVEVGTRGEPSLDTIATLEPDLIVGSIGSIPDEAMDQMSRIAPILLFEGSTADDALGTVTNNFRTIAAALGKEAEAEAVVAKYEETVQNNAAALAEAGLAGTPVVLAAPYAQGANVTIRMHTATTAVGQVALAMGLETAWDEKIDDGWGLAYTDLEGLGALPGDTYFINWVATNSGDDSGMALLADNALWNALEFVQADRAVDGAVGIWAYGGPASMTAWSDDLLNILTAQK